MSPAGGNRLAWWLATVGEIGRSPFAPGTLGSLAGAAIAWVLPVDLAIQTAVALGVTAAGCWAAGALVRWDQQHDPSYIVIDEVAGMLVAGFLLPKHAGALVSAFLFFRLFDITKWFPMKQLERLPGGWGIMADDLAAGVLARAAVFLVWRA